MAIIDHLIGKGMPTGLAGSVCGGTGNSETTITAAGNSQGTATLIATGTCYISVVSSSGKGAQLPSCSPNSTVFVFNGGANTASIYGQTGEAIGAGSANAAFALGTKKGAFFTKVSATQWGQVLSA